MISGVQQRHTIQHSLPLGLSLLHLKLRPRGRQTAQHISWSQSHSTSPLISESILRTSTPVWTTPDIATTISNINRALKNVKSDVSVNFICSDLLDVTVVTYKITSSSDLQIIENYIKNVNCIDIIGINTPHLPQSKSYLKIIGISYYQHDKSNHLTLKDVKDIIKQNQIFDNVVLTSKSQIIKVSLKSDIAIVWLNIWDMQSESKAEGLINWCFDIGNHIAIVWGTNTNPDISQCKNCWHWSHATLSCRISGTKCIKCNRLHKSEHHCHFAWCCKANNKVNLPRLETKKGEQYPYSFKCSNYWGDHQVDSNVCPFWRHWFN